MIMAAPPVRWQQDVVGRTSSRGAAVETAPSLQGNERISDAWRHVKTVTEVSKEYDLFDLLQNTRREDTYQFHIPGVSSRFIF